ncbi:MAG: hypothetical protein AB7O31_13560 [Burkholderiales bacterium]
MHRFWILGPSTTGVARPDNVLQLSQPENVELVLLICPQKDKDTDQIWIHQDLLSANMLNSINQFNTKKSISFELPRNAIHGFDLDRDGIPASIGGE